MKNLAFLFLMLVFIGMTANCSSDNEMPDTPVEMDEEAEERNFQDSMSAQGVINQMYDLLENKTYMLNRGRNINPSEPNRFYYVCNDAKEAALFYNDYCTDEPLQVVYENVGDSLVAKFDVVDRKSNFGNYGYTSLSIGEGNPIFATIELSLNSVGDTHELIFVPESFMPFNSDYSAFKSPYTLGDIYKDKEDNQWLCVRQSQPSADGYLVRLADGDGVNWERKFIKDHYKTVWYAEAKPGNTIAGRDAWEGFISVLKWSQGQNALTAMKEGTGGVSMENTRDLMQSINNENENWRIFQVGDVRKTGPDTHWGKCTRELYKIWVPYIVIHGKHGYCIGEAYAWHELENKNLKEESLKVGKELLQLSFYDKGLSNLVKKIYPVQDRR